MCVVCVCGCVCVWWMCVLDVCVVDVWYVCVVDVWCVCARNTIFILKNCLMYTSFVDFVKCGVFA